MSSYTVPVSIDDPINRQILTISEDQISGFEREPFGAIAERAGLDTATVVERIAAMLAAGTIRRVRQTLITTSLARGALVAWRVPTEKIDAAFDWMFTQDPFSGHAVLRSTDADTEGAKYKLWTTLKVPPHCSLEAHCDHVAGIVGAEAYRLMPAKKLFKLGVGHMRRRTIEIGQRTEEPGAVIDTKLIELSPEQWRVLTALKREFTVDEIVPNPWARRAADAGIDLETFCATAESLNALGVVGRFSTFLEHVKKHADGKAVTRYNALFHWAVPAGREIEAGKEVGRHICMTHAYWREGGPEFNNVNIMGVAHSTDRDVVLGHKTAINEHMKEAGIPVSYTAVFWGGRSEIKPSEISPEAYVQWCEAQGIVSSGY
jgi:hypothetical protein